MEPNLLETVVAQLEAAPPGTAKKIADETGLAYDSILRIKRGDISNPRFDTLQAIDGYFRAQRESPSVERTA